MGVMLDKVQPPGPLGYVTVVTAGFEPAYSCLEVIEYLRLTKICVLNMLRGLGYKCFAAKLQTLRRARWESNPGLSFNRG